MVCVDGAYWILKARINDRYHGSGFHICGQDDLFVPTGLLLIELVKRDIGPVR